VQAQSARSSAEPLQFRDVTKRYPGSAAPAVDGLSLEVPAGEICVLVGPSGCGKTTAMRMVNRMIDMTSGDILLGGRSVKDRKPAELRREIGYVIQQIGLFPHRTIGENIATVPSLLGWDKKRTAARVEELFDLVGLDAKEMRGRYPAQLSGGQRQRIGVARALAADPSAMLMDEPFGAIDPINRERLQDEFLRLQATVRKTIVFVTHDIDEAIKMGDRIAILREGGHLAQYGTPEEILSRPADDFVARFVGTDRGLKRLSLTTLGQLELPQPNGHRPDLRLPAAMSARDALSVLLTAGGGDALVVGEGERVLGIASVSTLGGLLSGAKVAVADVEGSADAEASGPRDAARAVADPPDAVPGEEPA
jgi:osmoprotectant transport system ATP-binding protein